MMQSLGRQYVRYFNHAYCRSGTLWEGRFKSCVIDAERYLLHCLRYIELNPVRAGMVNDPADYAWSSYHTNALGRSSSLCTHHEVYLHLHPDPVRRLAAYRALFQAPVDGELVREIRQSVNAGMALGDSHFREEIERLTGRRVTPEKPGPKKGKPTHESNQQELLL